MPPAREAPSEGEMFAVAAPARSVFGAARLINKARREIGISKN
jgi:hypothetical protein